MKRVPSPNAAASSTSMDARYENESQREERRNQDGMDIGASEHGASGAENDNQDIDDDDVEEEEEEDDEDDSQYGDDENNVYVEVPVSMAGSYPRSLHLESSSHMSLASSLGQSFSSCSPFGRYGKAEPYARTGSSPPASTAHIRAPVGRMPTTTSATTSAATTTTTTAGPLPPPPALSRPPMFLGPLSRPLAGPFSENMGSNVLTQAAAAAAAASSSSSSSSPPSAAATAQKSPPTALDTNRYPHNNITVFAATPQSRESSTTSSSSLTSSVRIDSDMASSTGAPRTMKQSHTPNKALTEESGGHAQPNMNQVITIDCLKPRRLRRSRSDETSSRSREDNHSGSRDNYYGVETGVVVPNLLVGDDAVLTPQHSRENENSGTGRTGYDGSPCSALTTDTTHKDLLNASPQMPLEYQRQTINDTTHVTVATKQGVFLAPLWHLQNRTTSTAIDNPWSPLVTNSHHHHQQLLLQQSQSQQGNGTMIPADSELSAVHRQQNISAANNGLPTASSNPVGQQQQMMTTLPASSHPLAPPPALWIAVLLPDPIPPYRVARTEGSHSYISMGMDGRPDPRYYFAVSRDNVTRISPRMRQRALEVIGAPMCGLRVPAMALQYLQRYFVAVQDPYHFVYIERENT
jgi:hypothetical protein